MGSVDKKKNTPLWIKVINEYYFDMMPAYIVFSCCEENYKFLMITFKENKTKISTRCLSRISSGDLSFVVYCTCIKIILEEIILNRE